MKKLFKCGVTLALAALAAVCKPASVQAAEPETEDAPLWYSHRDDADGDVSYGLFEPSLFTGAASTNVPIVVPAGTNGVQPTLSLSYNSRSNRGNAGMGWSLSLSTIQRSTKYGADLAQTASKQTAIYELDGMELVRGTTQAGDGLGCTAQRYYKETEDHTKVLFCEGSDYWVVISREGVKYVYGQRSSANSRLQNGSTTHAYYLDTVIDPHGLSWEADYLGYGAGAPNAAPRLDELRWTYYNPGTGASPLGEVRSAKILWQLAAQPWQVEYATGQAVASQYLIDAIEVRLDGARIRKYDLTYAAALSPESDAPMLESVQMLGVTDATSLPAMTFTYQHTNQATTGGFDPVGVSVQAHERVQSGAGTIEEDFLDLNGDGHRDRVVATTSPWQVTFGHGLAGMDAGPTNWAMPGGLKIREVLFNPPTPPHVEVDTVDMDGDGLQDVYELRQTGSSNWYRNTGSGFAAGVTWNVPNGGIHKGPLREVARITGQTITTNTITQLIDANGDGCPDYFAIDRGAWYVRRNRACDPTPTYDFDNPVLWEWGAVTPPDYLGSSISSREAGEATTTAQLVELNGDGLIDFFWNGNVYLGTGRGFLPETDTTYASDLAAALIWDQAGFALNEGTLETMMDVNSDGRPDAIHTPGDPAFFLPCRNGCGGFHQPQCPNPDLNARYWSVYVNTGQGFRTTAVSWDAYSSTQKPFYFAQNDFVFACQESFLATEVMDFNADGVPDVVQAGNKVYLGNGIKNELLVKIDNGIGGESQLVYSPLVADDGANVGNLHFPVHVLSSMVTKDGLYTAGASTETQYTRTFAYERGYFDPDRRTFRGFGEVDTTSADNLGTPTTHRRFIFANGDDSRFILTPYTDQADQPWTDHDILAGTLFGRLSGPALDDYRVEDWSLYSVTPLAEGNFEPRLEGTRHVDTHSTTGVRSYSATANQLFDIYGNVTKHTDYGEYDGTGAAPDYSAGSDEVTTQTNHAVNTVAWIVSPPATVSTYEDEALQNLLQQRKLYYDGNTQTGQISVGDLTKDEELVRYTGEADQWAATVHTVDPYGNVLTTTDPLGAVTTFTYDDENGATPDAFAYLFKTEQSVTLGPGPNVTLTSTSDWDERFGAQIQEVDPNGRRVERTFDDLGRLTLVESTPPDDPGGTLVTLSTQSYNYGGASGSTSATWVERVDYADATTTHTKRTYFDGLLRPVQHVREVAGGFFTHDNVRFSHQGVTDRATFPYDTATSAYSAFSFWDSPPPVSTRVIVSDWAAREVQTHLAGTDGNTYYVTTTAYEPLESTVTDAKGVPTKYTRRAGGEIVQVEEFDAVPTLQATTTFTYDRLGNLIEATDTETNTMRMFYDSRGLKRAMEDPDMSNCPGGPSNCPWLYEYDLRGALIAQTDAKGQRIEFDRDELGRIFTKDYICASCSEVDVVTTYDGATFGLGRLQKVERGVNNVIEYAYDNWGRTPSVTRTAFGSVETTTSTFGFDDRLLTMTYPTGETATYTYDGGARVKAVDFGTNDIVDNIAYDALDRPTAIYWGNTLVTVTHIGANEKIQTLDLRHDDNQFEMQHQYTYDAVGNTTEIDDDWINGWKREYTYDWADRLTRAKHIVNMATEHQWDYTYSPIGNMMTNSEWAEGQPPPAGEYEYGLTAGPHAVTQIMKGSVATTFVYDDNGNMTLYDHPDGDRDYTYNFDGRLASVSDTSQSTNPNVTLTYDGGGARVRKQWTDATGSREIRYIGAHYEQYFEGSNQNDDRYVMLGGARIAFLTTRDPGKVYFLHPDVQGTIGVTSDENGTIVGEQLYAPYGDLYSSLGSNPGLRYGYTGQEEDAESEMVHLGVRQLHTNIARFPQPDSVVPDPLNPQTWNRYSYALNNPTRYTDPSGYTSPEASSKNCTDKNLGDCDPPALLLPIGRFVNKLLKPILRGKMTGAHDVSSPQDRQLLQTEGISHGDFMTEGQERNERARYFADVGGFVGGYVTDEAALYGAGKLAGEFELAGSKKTSKFGRWISRVFGAGKKSAPETFEIIDGVRRAKAAQLAERGTIRAEIMVDGTVARTVDVPIENLRSPFKSEIDISTPRGEARFNRVMRGTQAGDELPPILVQPGERGPSIFDVVFRRYDL